MVPTERKSKGLRLFASRDQLAKSIWPIVQIQSNTNQLQMSLSAL